MRKSKTSNLIVSYFWGNIAVSIASLISFPIFTRVFSVSSYGILALVTSTLTIIIAFSKMGIQNSIIRWYPEYEIASKEKKSVFFSTYLYSITMTGVFVAIVFIILVPYITHNMLSLDDSLPFYIGALFIPFHSFYSTILNFYKAQKESALFNIVAILETYLPLIVGILFLFYFGAKVSNFLIGGFLAKILYSSYFYKKIHDRHHLSFRFISYDLLGNAFWYGFPLMLFELVSNLLAYGDRFIIKYFLKETDVAIYSVGYNLSMYLANIFTTPLNTAIQVEYMGIWTKFGKDKTEEYLSKILKAIMYFGVMFCMFSILNFKYIILLFASTKYIESVKIAPLVMTSLIVYSLYPIFGAGIYIAKATKNLLYCVFGALVLNFTANFILIPRVGIMGAAIATFASYAIASFVIYRMGSKIVSIKMENKSILLCLLAGCTAYYLCTLFEFNSIVLNVLSKSISSLCIYSAILIIFDREFGSYLQMGYSFIRPAFNRNG